MPIYKEIFTKIYQYSKSLAAVNRCKWAIRKPTIRKTLTVCSTENVLWQPKI